MQNKEQKNNLREYLSPSYHPLIEKDNGFYASEDSKLLSLGIEQTINSLENNKEPITLIDLCTGTAKIPAQFLIDRKVNSVLGIDISLEYSKKIANTVNKLLAYTKQENINEQKFEMLQFDLLKDNSSIILKALENKDGIKILSANPPWIPVPQNIEFQDKKFSLVNGGPDGLQFIEPILNIASAIKSEKISVNIPSIADIQKLSELLQFNNLYIENIQALDTYSYGIDAAPEIQNHYKNSILQNSYRYDNNGKLRYLILNLRLTKSTSDKVNTSIKLLNSFLDIYKNSNQNLMLLEDFLMTHQASYKLWQLSNDDKIRILKRI